MALRSKAVIPGDAPAAWGRFEYPRVQVPAKGGGIATVRRPALAVRARHPDRAPGEAEISIRADAWLDTGADASVMPMWLVQQAGIPIDKGARRKAYSVSGTLWAYGARVGLEVRRGDSWLDIGVSEVLVPDTAWSRNPDVRRPPLLGPCGFFDRVRMCIDHLQKEFWIRMPEDAR